MMMFKTHQCRNLNRAACFYLHLSTIRVCLEAYRAPVRRVIIDQRNDNQVPCFLDSNIFNKCFANIGNITAISIFREEL